MYAFDYKRPQTVDEALAALAGEGAQLLAGGMSLVPVMRHRLAAPGCLIDLNRIAALRAISVTADTVRIGAMATHASVAASAEVRAAIPALALLAGGIGDPLVRKRGTIGGSLANNDPAACYPSALLGLGGTVITNRRSIPGDDYILGTFQTALEPGEIILAVDFPIPDQAVRIKFENFGSRFSIVGLFLTRTKGKVRIGVTGAGQCAFRLTAMEQALDHVFRPEAALAVTISPAELLTDIHADAEYRAHLITELSSRAVAQCLGNNEA